MTDVIVQVREAAKTSSVVNINWPQRGRASLGYIEGMAVTFGRVYCKLKASDPAVIAMATATTADARRDALAHYAEQFNALGISNATAGIDTLRHLFVLMMGLGMRESSGKHCEGRDMSADNVTADTCEAGLFQTSFNARSAHPLLRPLFLAYHANPSGFLDIFKLGVRCTDASLQNFGDGEGRDFQQLSKECPAFAAEFAALGLRNIRAHWGPITRREAELRQECDELFLKVQQIVDATSGACADLV